LGRVYRRPYDAESDGVKNTDTIWERCWSYARVNIGLSDEEFFSLTPRKYKLLRLRHEELESKKELLNGLLCSVVANFSANGVEEPLSAFDFMPSRMIRKTEPVSHEAEDLLLAMTLQATVYNQEHPNE
jgi:hypothetical protein